ncbi:hypothetical protein REPUB_Repub07fG0096700 [Reevesia pubescens]
MDSNGIWAIRYFEEEHNHEMCHESQTCFIRSKRKIKPSDLAEVKAMKGVGIRTSHIMNYLTQQAGGIQNVGFTTKDLYNKLNMVCRDEIYNGDANAVIAYFQVKKEADIGIYMNYSTDDENRLHNLFWADATSRSDYACFGDVVAFDTTYKKNAYDRPLMPIVGVNHHHQTIVFGIALLADETTDTFVWVLRTFLHAMLNKPPTSFVTDGDRAMQRAIRTVFPTARHRLCTWHLPRNAKANIPDVLFVEAFNRCMNAWWTREEFDREWDAMVRHFNVDNHPWVIEKDRTREMWAQAYITGHFFGTLRSTQRCESMNAYLAIYLESKKTFMEFVRAIDQGISKMRTNELEADYVSRHTDPYRLTKLVDIECHAASVYTRDSFSVFQEELQHETLYRLREPIIEDDATRIYTLGQYKQPNRRIQVVCHASTQRIQCSCMKFETVGIPCTHQIHVMKLEDMSKISASLIMQRWTKDAKVCAPSFVDCDVEPQHLQMVRYASLSSSCNRMCYVASKTTDSFNQAKMEIIRLTTQMEELCNLEDSLAVTKKPTTVLDPVKKRAKGKEVGQNQKIGKAKKCGYCKTEGHTKVTCPLLKIGMQSVGLGGENYNTDNLMTFSIEGDKNYSTHTSQCSHPVSCNFNIIY